MGGLVQQHSCISARKEHQTPKLNLVASSETLPFKKGVNASSEVSSESEKAGVERAESLEILFGADGKEKSVQILRRPLGAEFGKIYPKKSPGSAKIRKVQPESYASELGLEVGWIVKAVGGEDVSQMSFQNIQDLIKSGMLRLPEQSQ